MKQIRKILELNLVNPGMSIRTIARATKVSRPVVKEYLGRLATHPLSMSELSAMNDETLKRHMELETPSIQDTIENGALLDWLITHVGELSKVGMTRRLLHERYLRDYPEGLRYSQFCFHLKQRFQTPEASALLEHKAGDKLYMDFTGQKLRWKDTRGTEYVEEIFLAVMGASSYLFSLPVPSQKQEDFAWAVIQAFEFYGGVPCAVVPDCLKSAVLHHDGHESESNPLFQRVLDYYGVISLPARPHHPKDKPQVEGAVNLVYRQILAKMETGTFENRQELLAWWRRALERINATLFQKLPGTRKSRFETIDKPALKPLPDTPFALTGVLSQTVTTTGVIYIPADKTYYSVPTSLQGNKVEILLSPDHIEVWYENERKALHERQPGAGKVLCPSHRPHAHQWFADRNTQELIRTLSREGDHIGSWSRRIAENASHEDQAWMILEGVRCLIRKYPNRLDTTCRLALSRETFTLKGLKKILKDEDDLRLIEDEQSNLDLPFHENVRGPSYFATREVEA